MPLAFVLEDDPQIASIVVRMLARRGIESTACGARSAAFVELNARPRRFDLAYVDRKLPDGSGVDVAVELRRLDPDVPIVFATGDLGEVAVDSVIVLRKPFTIGAFDEAVDACLAERDRRQGGAKDAEIDAMPQPA